MPKKQSDEHRARLSEALVRYWESPEGKAAKERSVERMRGNTYSVGREYGAESRAKLSAALTGKKFSDERRANISAGKRGKKVSEETKRKISDGMKLARSVCSEE